MPWSGRSFMLDIKPQSEYANLFVECPENDDRDLIRILKNGVELCTSPENVEGVDTADSNVVVDGDKRLQEQIDNLKLDTNDTTTMGGRSNCLRACIKGFCLHPESVTNYAWTDDQHTFSCKLKVDFGDDSERKKLTDAAKLLKKNAINIEQFCNKNSKRNAVLECNKCGQVFLHADAKPMKLYPLPSSDYNEIADGVFCHLHDDDGGGGDINHGHFPAVPKTDQCFINSIFLILNAKLIDGGCHVADSNVIICKNCHQQVGCLHSSGYNVSNINAFRFYHVATNFYAKNVENTELIERNFFDLRYETKERYFAWLLLSECESQSSLKFVVKSLDSHPKLLVWLLDSYSVIVSGKLDEEDLSNENKEAALPCKPFPALKLLFKILNDSSVSDPRVSGQDASIVSLCLPLEACEILNNYLEGNSESLPPACRHVGQFSVGFLHIEADV